MKILYAIVILVACAGAGGCQRPLHADAPILDGPVLRCNVLLSDAKAEYRETAKAECETAKTAGSCEIVEHIKLCTEWQ